MHLSVSKLFRSLSALALLLILIPTLHAQQVPTPGQRWTEAQANAWYAQQPWPVGADFLPSTAINELEMWQADTFDPATIDRELGWAEAICTEYMARNLGSTFDTILPIAREHHVGAINWGLVAGKSQTYLPWDSWQRPYVDHQPSLWQHDIFHPDGTPYRQREVEIIRNLTSGNQVLKP